MMILALAIGLFLGIVFFGGLWFTIKKALGSPYASIWFLASSLLRTALVLLGFYCVSSGGLLPLILSLTGFVAARFLVLSVTKPLDQKALSDQKVNVL